LANPTTSYEISISEDKKNILALRNIANECERPDAMLHINIAQHHTPLAIPIGEIDNHDVLNSIYKLKTAFIYRLQIDINPAKKVGQIVIERMPLTHKVTITFASDMDLGTATNFLAATYRNLKPYSPTPELNRLLGNEMAEFYLKRDETLNRLEELETKVLEQNIEYRQKVDNEKHEFERRIRQEVDDKKGELEERYQTKRNDLEERSQALEKLKQEIDDRGSKHARRQTRLDLQEKLSEQNLKFGLTKDTQKKRIPIHILFILLIIAAGSLFGIAIYSTIIKPELVGDWKFLLRISMSAIALGAAVVYYIKWNDNWFRRHSDEEFRLKRLALDIDRVNLITEMALEFKDEEGLVIPSELIESFTKGLFTQETKDLPAKHPSEDLVSALIGASEGLRLKVPGFGEITLDRKGIRSLRKSLSYKDQKKNNQNKA